MFPFSDDPHTACIVCSHVLNKEEPITYISHDEDGMWQFLCSKEHTTDDARIVSLEEVYALDPSIGEVADMPCGCCINKKESEASYVCRGFYILEKVEFDQIMNIDLNYAKNNDSISVEETFKRLEEDIQLNLVMRKTSKR